VSECKRRAGVGLEERLSQHGRGMARSCSRIIGCKSALEAVLWQNNGRAVKDNHRSPTNEGGGLTRCRKPAGGGCCRDRTVLERQGAGDFSLSIPWVR
jgi:hypothetical protein